jgi:putative two-component system response regulator
MGLPEERVEGLQLAASIHDIGKISVPAEILCKPGKISEAEFSLVKAHATVGHDILEPIDFPWPIAQIGKQHHEKLDGSGYPEGLSGGEILLEARIMAIADVVEAMASHRPYRPALGIDAALAKIDGNTGRLYDAEAGSACLKLLRGKGFAFQ